MGSFWERASRRSTFVVLAPLVSLGGGGCGEDRRRSAVVDAGGDASALDVDPPAPACRGRREERQPFFGDLHVHTALSLDANLQGTRLRPADAYRFARGERVGLPPLDDAGQPTRWAQLPRPLDFVGISDHAEFLGLVTTCLTPGLPGYDDPLCKAYRTEPANAFVGINAGLAIRQGEAEYFAPCTADNAFCGSAALTAWNEVREAAKGAQDTTEACAFTSFVAYEWSASPGTQNLHRNVVFRGAAVPRLPFGYFDGNQEEDLWDALDRDCLQKPNCDVLTIPHNSNLAAGLMFETVGKDGRSFDAAYAARRRRFEPLVEVFQHKGASECLPEMGPDELCDFEQSPYNTLGSATLGGPPDTLVPKDFVRDALAQGLLLEKSLGANPFAYGMIASTDTHFGTPGAVDETAFQGHGGAGIAASQRTRGLVDSVWFNPGGLAVLWAEENSRASLFDAMKRREAYATSGPRIVLRFFGGFDVPESLCSANDFAQQGYARGVPMGGDLPAGKPGAAPRFAVSAMRDPGVPGAPGGALQRIQIVKGWIEGARVQYAVHDVAGGPNGADVDLATCAPRGAGEGELCSVWKDPDFEPAESAFYYARVLENPSCRWHKRACLARKVDCAAPAEGFEGCCAGFPETQQERAWSSPIFYRGAP